MEAYRDNIVYEQIKSISNRIDKKDNNKLVDFTTDNPINIVKWEPYNDIDIEVKRLELNDIEDILAQKELELATLEGALHAFELKYLRIVGVYFAELDDIRAKIAEAVAQLYLEDDRLQEEAARARAQARESAEASDTARSARDSISAPFNPSAAIKTLFREIAKRLHPDLGSDDEDRLRRHQFMAEANQAYRSGDEFRLQAIIREWDATLKSVSKDAITRFEQMIQKISQAKDRLRRIQITIDQLQHSDLNQLKERAEAERKDGEDLFLKMSEHLQREISQERARLSEILQRSSPR
jgi:hypothetical protein